MRSRVRHRTGLGTQVFLSILLVSTGSVAVVGLFARSALSKAFDDYLSTLPTTMGRGMGRMRLGAAEQSFIASVDQSVLVAALVAALIASVVAVVLAAYLSRPLRRLESAAETLAEGDLSHRVESAGPSEVAALGEAFNRMADSLEQAEEARRRMIADVAHELRNPLAAARAQAEGMVDGVLRSDEARLASLVEDLAHLSNLVDELQELSVAEAGRLRYEMREADLVRLVRREAESARALLRPGVELTLEVPDEAVTLTVDERRIGQVVRNLLSNAARHTASGSVLLRLTESAEGVEVAVEDTGEGIAPDEVAHIFERFYRADASRAAHTGGAGLGLAISRTIVRDHGGDVFARSALGHGSTIGFTLPRQ